MHALKILIAVVVIAAVLGGGCIVLYEEIIWLCQVWKLRGKRSPEPSLPWKSALKITVVVVGACALIVAGLFGIRAL